MKKELLSTFNQLISKYAIWIVFIFPSLISVCLILIPSVYPSLDGGSHIYNSHILKELILNKESPYSNYYELNHVLVPNWLSHFILAGLLFLFSPAWALKVFLVALILSHLFFFYKIILKVNPANKILSIIILPFIFSSFFYVGLYNQQLSLVLFLAFAYWLLTYKTIAKPNLKFYAGLILFSFLFWFSSIVTYSFFLIFIVIFFSINAYKSYTRVIDFFSIYLRLLVVFLPTLLLSLNFINQVKMKGGELPISVSKKLELFIKLEPLITFDNPGESRFTLLLSMVLLILFVFGLLSGFKKNTMFTALVISLLLLAILFIVVPNNAGAGMLSYRLAMLFYFCFLLLIVAININFSWLFLVCTIVAGIHLGLVFKRHNGRIVDYAKVSQNFVEIGKQIPVGSTIWPIQFGHEWFLGHTNNWASISNSCINYENYETCYPWFPIRFKVTEQNKNTLYHKLRLEGNLKTYRFIPAQYLLVSGIDNENETEIKAYLLNFENCRKVAQASDSSIRLYKLK